VGVAGHIYIMGAARACYKVKVHAAVMEAGEVEFVAEKEMVTITPNFSENKITLISVREATKKFIIA
jgi:uncharacterized lipoprotein YbaY